MNDSRRFRNDQWIVSPAFDLLFFSTLWLPPLLVLTSFGFDKIGLGYGLFSIWLYHIFIRIPHFLATFHVTFLQKDQREYYLKHWFQYIAFPLLILAVYAYFSFVPSAEDFLLYPLLLQVTFFWGYWHIAMQNFGILQLYHRRNKKKRDLSMIKAEKLIFLSVFGVFYLIQTLIPFLNQSLSLEILRSSESHQYTVANSILVLVALAYLFFLRKQEALTVPVTIFFLVSLIVMMKWPFYDRFSPDSWFLVFNGHHSVAYIGLVFLMGWNRQAKGDLTFKNAFKPFLFYFLPLVYFAAVIVWLRQLHADQSFYSRGHSELLLGFFTVHYYLESLVWRFKNPHNRVTTLPLLRQPAREPAVQQS